MVSFFIVATMFLWISSVIGQENDNLERLGKAFPAGSTRSERFPSVEERVKLYMGNWYLPPCNTDGETILFDKKNKSAIQLRLPSNLNLTIDVFSDVEVDRIFFLNEEIIQNCAYQEVIQPKKKSKKESASQQNTIMDAKEVALKEKALFKADKKAKIFKNMRLYCNDVLISLVPSLSHVKLELESAAQTDIPPIMMQFGDLQHSHVYGVLPIPHFKKFRLASAKRTAEEPTTCVKSSNGDEPQHQPPPTHHNMQPIIWKLGMSRHYGLLPLVEAADRPWEQKKPKAIFRGQLTGSVHAYDRHNSDRENCIRWPRCRFVFENSESDLIDAKLTSTRHRMPDILDSVEMTAPTLSMEAMLEYKAIIMLEGNDVASGLKWALLSQSIVLMSRPVFTSWALE